MKQNHPASGKMQNYGSLLLTQVKKYFCISTSSRARGAKQGKVVLRSKVRAPLDSAEVRRSAGRWFSFSVEAATEVLVTEQVGACGAAAGSCETRLSKWVREHLPRALRVNWGLLH